MGVIRGLTARWGRREGDGTAPVDAEGARRRKELRSLIAAGFDAESTSTDPNKPLMQIGGQPVGQEGQLYLLLKPNSDRTAGSVIVLGKVADGLTGDHRTDLYTYDPDQSSITYTFGGATRNTPDGLLDQILEAQDVTVTRLQERQKPELQTADAPATRRTVID